MIANVTHAARTRQGLTDTEWSYRSPSTSLPAEATLSGWSAFREDGRYSFTGGDLRVVVEGRPPTWMLPTVKALCEVLDLPADWDSYGSPTVDSHVVAAAIDILMQVMRDDTPAPSVVPTNRGSVQFEWHTRGVDIEVEVVSPQRIRLLFEDQASGVEKREEITWDLRALADAIGRLSYNG